MSTQEKARKYQRRKNRSNVIAKKSPIDHRCIANKSNTYTYCQILDRDGKVVVMKNDKGISGKTKTERAQILGSEVAKIAAEKGVKQVVFDRNGHLYHGRIAALCEGLREGGITV